MARRARHSQVSQSPRADPGPEITGRNQVDRAAEDGLQLSLHPATADRPRRAPDPPKTSPRRTHLRIPDGRLTGPTLSREEAGHRPDRVFEPNTVINRGPPVARCRHRPG